MKIFSSYEGGRLFFYPFNPRIRTLTRHSNEKFVPPYDQRSNENDIPLRFAKEIDEAVDDHPLYDIHRGN
jgi:hypothetical protein